MRWLVVQVAVQRRVMRPPRIRSEQLAQTYVRRYKENLRVGDQVMQLNGKSYNSAEEAINVAGVSSDYNPVLSLGSRWNSMFRRAKG